MSRFLAIFFEIALQSLNAPMTIYLCILSYMALGRCGISDRPCKCESSTKYSVRG